FPYTPLFRSLGAAGEAVGEVDGLRPGLPERRQQGVLGDLDRDVVVALLHAEVPREAAASGEPGDRRAGAGEDRGVGVPAHDRVVVAVRLGVDLDSIELGRLLVRAGTARCGGLEANCPG